MSVRLALRRDRVGAPMRLGERGLVRVAQGLGEREGRGMRNSQLTPRKAR
jgi:hypothetical protein